MGYYGFYIFQSILIELQLFRTKREQLWVAFISVNNVYEVFAR